MSTEQSQQAPSLDDILNENIPDNEVELSQEPKSEIAPEPELPEFEPPALWDKETKDAWKAMHAYKEGRPHLEKLHGQWGKTQGYLTKIEQENSKYRKNFDPINEFLTPYAQQWASEGMDTISGLRQIMAFRDGLLNNPQETLMRLADMTGVNLQEALADAPYIDPHVQKLQQEQQNLIYELQNMKRQEELRTQEQNKQWLFSQVQAFETAKDIDGNLKHPHAAEVFNDMLALHSMGRAADVEEAYSLAVQLNPKLQAAAAKKAEKDAIQNAKAKSNVVAQTLAKSGVAKPHPGRGEKNKQSLDEILDEIYSE